MIAVLVSKAKEFCLHWYLKKCVAKSRKKVLCSGKKPMEVLDSVYPPRSSVFSTSFPQLHCVVGLAHPSMGCDGLCPCPFPESWLCCFQALLAHAWLTPVSHHTHNCWVCVEQSQPPQHLWGCPVFILVDVPEVAKCYETPHSKPLQEKLHKKNVKVIIVLDISPCSLFKNLSG